MRRALGGLARAEYRLFLLMLTAVLLTELLPTSLRAQSTALLTGTVVDASGSVVPEAQVVCRNTQTGLTYNDTTNAEGLFRFPSLPIGSYELVVTHAGFRKLTRSGLQLLTGQGVDLHLVLAVGEIAQSVNVSMEAPLCKQLRPKSKQPSPAAICASCHLNGRNPLQLVTLTPGTELTGVGTAFCSSR